MTKSEKKKVVLQINKVIVDALSAYSKVAAEAMKKDVKSASKQIARRFNKEFKKAAKKKPLAKKVGGKGKKKETETGAVKQRAVRRGRPPGKAAHKKRPSSGTKTSRAAKKKS